MKIKAIDFGDKIIWTDFEQPHRNFDSHNFWDYSEFGQFSFDKTEYNEQLDRLKQTMINSTK